MFALLVEDSPPLGRAMMRLLQSKGYQVHWVATATDAVERLLAGQHHYDLATLDHDLGAGPTGEVVAKHIAGLAPDHRPARVEVHSGNDAAAARMVALLRDAGVNVHRKDLAA
jgi:CheY-like chemotaxis protein